MVKIVTIHQPNYLPWIGLFSKVQHSDCLIIGDTYLLGGKSTFNRNKIRTIKGWKYLTIPLGHKTEGRRICDIQLPVEKYWRGDHWRIIHDNYLKSDFFKPYYGFFEELYLKDFKYVSNMNLEAIDYLMKCFNIDIPVIRASEITVDSTLEKTDLMIALLKGVGAEAYLSGPSGREYLETEKFSQNEIKLKYFRFQHPKYPQRYPGFEPNMAAIDLLFNVGPRAKNIVRSSGIIED